MLTPSAYNSFMRSLSEEVESATLLDKEHLWEVEMKPLDVQPRWDYLVNAIESTCDADELARSKVWKMVIVDRTAQAEGISRGEAFKKTTNNNRLKKENLKRKLDAHEEEIDATLAGLTDLQQIHLLKLMLKKRREAKKSKE